ncbi:MAG: hypothetical protein A3H59_01750 [Candidatus Jacksonbacteria bacterium RIFCSPLOWO2_02_FULL_43_9]|nr:MAG: hypothetical protein UV70_C0015G0004 [Parcubacteria group bacterium GW2011_GWA2_43_13]MBS3120752.1 DUF1871 family protein [Candidatus Woesearchaeota archaeon]OGY72510.1 MAG: hypothetical protein A3H59_01750 [Candidatus Jacksonbacteria bacterium RIFCSPLOWO2_02_FULL_43_9]
MSVNRGFKLFRNEIRCIINKYDPFHLTNYGAPEDEYDAEVDRVLSFLVNKKNDRPLYEQIKQVFFDSFGKDVLFCNYKKLAKELREVCKKYKY